MIVVIVVGVSLRDDIGDDGEARIRLCMEGVGSLKTTGRPANCGRTGDL